MNISFHTMEIMTIIWRRRILSKAAISAARQKPRQKPRLRLRLNSTGRSPERTGSQKRKIETAYEKAENEIQKLEELIEETDAQIALPEYASDVAKLTELSKQKEQYEAELETAMEEWEKAAQALEELE